MREGQVVRNAPPVAAMIVIAVMSSGYARHLNWDMRQTSGVVGAGNAA
jgi:hypothetical protein